MIFCVSHCRLPYFSVFRILVARILDVALFDPELQPNVRVTMHQFFSFMEDKEELEDYLKHLAGECTWIMLI